MKRASGRPTRSFRVVKKDAASFIESVRKAYDPDSEFRERHAEALVPKFFKGLIEAVKGSKKLPDWVDTARIIEVNRFGAFRVREIRNSDDMRAALKISESGRDVLSRLIESGVKFREAGLFTTSDLAECKKIMESKRFREDFAVSGSAGNPFDEFIPLMGGPFNKQLYLHDYLDMMAKSFEAWNHNPLAHQIVKITTYFVLGRGVTFKAKNPEVQKKFSAWWDENDMGTRLEFWSDMLTRDGELMIRVFKNILKKSIFVRWVDPSTIWEIVTDLEDIERVFYYHQQYPTAFQVLYGGGPNQKFSPTEFGSSKYVINQIPAAEIHHIKINCSPNEKRGRSDLFSILGWLKRYKDFQTGVVLRSIIQSTFAWKNKLKGTDTDVDAFVSAFGTDQPEFGSVWVENEASDLQPMVADLKGGSSALADCPGVVNAISVGSGIPKEYLGNTDHATRATAVVASEPGVKKFQARQLLIGRLLKDLAQDWAANELASGGLKKLVADPDTGEILPLDTTIEFQFPEIAVEDRTAKLADINGGQVNGYISKRRAATMSAKELGVEEYNYDEEMDEIADEGMNSLSGMYPPDLANPSDPVKAALGKTVGDWGASGSKSPAPAASTKPKKAGGLSGQERRAIKQNDGH